MKIKKRINPETGKKEIQYEGDALWQLAPEEIEK